MKYNITFSELTIQHYFVKRKILLAGNYFSNETKICDLQFAALNVKRKYFINKKIIKNKYFI